ncbi:MAG: sigma-70 family RNA polymerase sigma factor [Bacteroidales bacterium]|nr:sigma-70 family RNA polymerase sigma factor [Bacteroidales bacterium]
MVKKITYPEEELASRCVAGDKSARNELYLKYEARIYAVCLQYTSNSEDAKDLLHDSWIKCIGQLSKYRYTGPGSLYQWMRRTVINMAIDQLRKDKMKRIPFNTLLPDASTYEILDEDPELISREIIWKMVKSLPSQRYEVFRKFCVEGYSHKDIAQMLGITEKGSASILAKARATLRENIKDYLAKKL